MAARAWGWTSAAPVALLLFWHGVAPPVSPAGDPAQPSVSHSFVADAIPGVVGAGRCSATACHGSPTPVYGSNVLRNEHTTWLTADPHANAYQVLLSVSSRTISRKLGREEPAHRDAQCLGCHSTPSSHRVRGDLATIREDGVGCESCHGPAEAWLAPHTSADWDRWDPAVRESRFGMFRSKVLARRVEVCAGCHIGEPAGRGRPALDVDHDLIAAGHPRLDFEFAAYLALLPAHWREKGRNAGTDFPARAWAIGQAVSARSSLRQLQASRAVAASTHPERWPEFSEYDCTSCHRELRVALPTRSRESPSSVAGSPVWGSWYYPMIALLGESSSLASHGRTTALLRQLRRTMEVPLPPPGDVAHRAAETERALAAWLSSLQRESFDATKVAGLLRTVRAAESSTRWTATPGWDETSQRYLALVPLRQASLLPVRDDPRLLQELRDFRKRVPVIRVRAKP